MKFAQSTAKFMFTFLNENEFNSLIFRLFWSNNTQEIETKVFFKSLVYFHMEILRNVLNDLWSLFRMNGLYLESHQVIHNDNNERGWITYYVN